MEKVYRNVRLDVEKVDMLLQVLHKNRKEMSLEMGLSKSYISNCFGDCARGGKGRMNTAIAQLLAMKLGVKLEDILYKEPEPEEVIVEESPVPEKVDMTHYDILNKKIDQLGKAIMLQNDILERIAVALEKERNIEE